MPKCYYCQNNFLTFKNFKLHVVTNHGKTSTAPIKCGEQGCWKGFSKLKLLENHYSKCHIDPIEPEPEVPNAEDNHYLGDAPEINLLAQPLELERNESLDIINNLDLSEHVLNSSSIFVSKLHSHTTIPANAVQMILDETALLTATHMSVLQSKVNKALSTEGGPSPEDIFEINKSFEILEKPFANLDTEYKRMKFFTLKGIFVRPISEPIGHKIAKKRVKGRIRNQMVDVTAQLIPLGQVLKLFFEYKNILNETVAYMSELYADNDNLSNVIQGREWKRTLERLRATRENDLFIPLLIYNDEYEVCNPLGTHRGINKLSAVYATVPCLPPTIQSCLNAIFLCLLFRAKDRTLCGPGRTFHKLIQSLNNLHDIGIEVEANGEKKQLYFVVALMYGDNLGMNQMLGLVECFIANHPCRIC